MVDKLQLDEPSGEPPRRPLWQRVLVWQIPIWLIAFLIVLSYNPRVDNCSGVKITYRTQTLCIANENNFFLFVENLACDVIDKGSVMADSLTMDSTAAQTLQNYFTQYNFSLETQPTEAEVLRGMRNAGYDSTSFCKNVAVAFWNAGVRLLGEGKTDSACMYFNKLEKWAWRDSVLTGADKVLIQQTCFKDLPIAKQAPKPIDRQGLTPFSVKGKYGYKNAKGQVVIEPTYDDADVFLEGLATVKIGKQWGFIDANNTMIIKPQFSYAYGFAENMALIADAKNRYGYINKTGRLVIPPQYEMAERFKNGIARVKIKKADNWMCIDKNGKATNCLPSNSKAPLQPADIHLTDGGIAIDPNRPNPISTAQQPPTDNTKQNTGKEPIAGLEQKTNDPFESQMVSVNGGTFMMGCENKKDGFCLDNELPVHRVTVSNFAISKYEVTQKQWRAVMGTDPSNNSKCDDCPVERVSWNDIQTFIQKLNTQTYRNYRLPTEAEWEYAAKGGNKSKNFLYSGSNRLEEVGWYKSNSSSRTHPVGQKKANVLGIYDMSGNVSEYCQDFYDSNYYQISPSSNPQGPPKGSGYVIRGGSWFNEANFCFNHTRVSNNVGDFNYGFRLVIVYVVAK